MVATHPGMSDQTDSNLPRDGAAKKTQTKFAIKDGMKSRIDGSRLSASPDHPEWGPDADPANAMSPEAKSAKSGPIKQAWGMETSPNKHFPEMGSAILSDAANLGRR